MVLIKLGGNFEDFTNPDIETPAEIQWIDDKDEMKRLLFIFLSEALKEAQG